MSQILTRPVAPVVAELSELLEQAGLTGRGGAGFPTARKLAAVRGRRPRVVVNACEGEPLSIKDAWVLSRDPEPMVAGLWAIAEAAGAARIVVAVHDGSAAHRAAVALPSRSWLEILVVPPGYVSSEASAITSVLDGGQPVPFTHRLPLAAGSARRAATVVLNAETVYWAGKIIAHGVSWFRSYGTVDEPGPRLASVSGAVARPGVVTSSAAVTIGELIDAAGGLAEPAQAVLLGGYGGSWLPLEDASALPWSDRALGSLGAATGAGVVHILAARECPLAVVGRQLEYLASQSARQCGPCMFGLPAVAADWRQLSGPPAQSAAAEERLRHRVGLLPGRGGCHHPDGAARNAASALVAFEDHLRRHRSDGCPVGRR